MTVCDQWRVSFAAFYEDMGPRPAAHMSIERKDVNGNYEPDNCCWATKSQQMRNRTDTIYITCPITGETKTLPNWADHLGLKQNTIMQRYCRGYPPEKLLTPPADQGDRSNAKLITYDGKTQSISAWAKEIGVTPQLIWQRLYRQGWDVARALNPNPER